MSLPTSRLPHSLYRARDVQQLDRIAIRDCGIDSFKLMQRAAAVAFNTLLEHWPQARLVRVFAGSGNNGGDGYVLAGLAREQGIACEVVQVAPAGQLQGDARQAWQWAQERQVRMRSLADFLNGIQEDSDSRVAPAHTILVDAMLGTGLDRAVVGEYAQAIQHINDSADTHTAGPSSEHTSVCAFGRSSGNNQAMMVLAMDIPSGLNADTGCAFDGPRDVAVKADVTVTFIGMKQGLLTGQGRELAGHIVFSNLDVPDKVYSSPDSPGIAAWRIDINDATRHLLPRAMAAHKGDHGHVVIVGGDDCHGGAVLLAAEAALRTGAGLVSVITRSVHRPALLARRPEVMVLGTEDEHASIQSVLERATVIVIGPGLGQSQWSRNLFQAVLGMQSARNIPLVIDADGLRLLAEKPVHATGTKRQNWILTPHPGEAAQLLNCSTEEIQRDRFAAVRNLQSTWGGCCLLKGSGSLICNAAAESGFQPRAQPGAQQGAQKQEVQPILLCTEGNPGMATAGMGDVLSGVAAGLVAQGHGLADSLKCAVVIHGEAGDLAAEQNGPRGLVAADLFPFIQRLVNPG